MSRTNTVYQCSINQFNYQYPHLYDAKISAYDCPLFEEIHEKLDKDIEDLYKISFRNNKITNRIP